MGTHTKHVYNLEQTEGITIAELVVKLKELPQEDFCDEYYLTFYKLVLEDPIETLKAQISNIEQNEKIAIEHSKARQQDLLNYKQKLKELENNDSN